mgnify:CR=1 FL=1
MNADRAAGTLYLVPTPLDHGLASLTPLEDVLPLGTIRVAARLTHWVAENAKATRAFLARVHAVAPLSQAVQSHHIVELPRQVHKKGDHDASAPAFDARDLLAPLLQGHDLGLISEAGMPAIADPGSSVVRAAHALGVGVVPLVGPVSILLALAASGLNGQNFAFVGYLPQHDDERVQRLRALEALALKSGQTQLFIETPYRNAALLRSALASLNASTRLAVCSGLTLAGARTASRSVGQWRALPNALGAIAKAPAVFGIGPN